MNDVATSSNQPAVGAAVSRPAVARAAERVLLLVSVLAAGAAVMIFEFVAVRVLQRYFGARLDVWAAEISVCLAGLALGYYLGGRMADRFASGRVLGVCLIIGALLGATIVRLGEVTGEWLLTVDTGIRWHPLVAALISSFFPILVLGAVMPQAIRLTVPSLSAVGKTAGRISALSTAGSILGVMAAGMFLLPNMGVRESMYLTCGVLGAIGIAMTAVGRRHIIPAAVFIFALIGNSASAQVIFDQYSAYHHILVEDSGDTRILRFDNDYESLMSLSDPNAGGFEYADFFHVPMILDPTIDRVLFIGLGGGTGPKSYLHQYEDVRVDVAELDPLVLKVAREYFYLPNNSRLNVTIADGRAFLQRSRGQYGAIMMDAYSRDRSGSTLPYHMATQEFFQLVWDRLENGGSLFFNVISTFGNGTILRDVATTMASVFQAVYGFQAQTSENTILIAQKIDPSTLNEDGTRDGEGWPDDPWLAHPLPAAQFQQLAQTLIEQGRIGMPRLAQRVTQFAQVRANGQILTDNYAPVDVRR